MTPGDLVRLVSDGHHFRDPYHSFWLCDREGNRRAKVVRVPELQIGIALCSRNADAGHLALLGTTAVFFPQGIALVPTDSLELVA